MPKKRHKPEEIVAKLRQVDVLVSQGQSVADAVRAIGVTEVTYYRWHQEYGGLKSGQVKRLKDLEAKNARAVSLTFMQIRSYSNKSFLYIDRYTIESDMTIYRYAQMVLMSVH